MKLKQQPTDFCVEELTDAVAGETGDFAFYRLEKTGWATPDAFAAIRRRWQIDHNRLSYGGLKDRHAATKQYFTIVRGPQRNLTHERINVTYLGQRTEPFTPNDIRANRFILTLRSMSDNAVSHTQTAMAEVAETGIPNYFDDQRFGSVNDTSEFVAKEMVFGRFERALWLALGAPYEHDRAEAKREKAILAEYWNKWPECQAKLQKSHARSLVSYLAAHPTDFKGAIERLRPELQGLYLSAYQSYLWNKMLAAWLTTNFGEANLAPLQLKLGRVPAPKRVPPEHRDTWETLSLPLPSARVKPEPGTTWLPIIEEVLQAEGLKLAEMKIKGVQKPFFSKGDRQACVRADNLSTACEPDELNRGRKKLLLHFDLPRGSYATMLVKRVTTAS